MLSDSLAAFATACSVGILTMLCIVQEYESKAAELRAKQAARRGETAAQGDAENDDKGAEVSVMLFCLCVVPCKTIYMCLYVSMNLSMNLSICVPNACLSACLRSALSSKSKPWGADQSVHVCMRSLLPRDPLTACAEHAEGRGSSGFSVCAFPQ